MWWSWKSLRKYFLPGFESLSLLYNKMNINIKNNIANILTIVRMILVPIFIIFYIIEKNLNSQFYFYIFLLASITDYFDGLIARKFKQESSFGKILDPLADKLLTVCLFSIIIQKYNTYYITTPCIIMILREIIVSSIRNISINNYKTQIQVTILGKLKTIFQLIGIGILIYSYKFNIILFNLGIAMLMISLALSITSFYKYFITFIILDRKTWKSKISNLRE